jgi:hypothetical protein
MDMTTGLTNSRNKLDRELQRIPMRRPGKPEEAADAVNGRSRGMVGWDASWEGSLQAQRLSVSREYDVKECVSYPKNLLELQ